MSNQEAERSVEEIAEYCIGPSNNQRNIDIVFRKIIEALSAERQKRGVVENTVKRMD